MSINRVNISGNLTRDGELRATAGGTSVLAFGVAVNDRARNQQTGNWEDRPNFVDCVMFGARADALARYLTKGTKVAIEGKLRWSQWQDRQTGQNRSKLEVVVDEVEFLSARGAEGATGGQQRQGRQQPVYGAPQDAAATPGAPAAPRPQVPPVQTPPSADVYDTDIPF
ncbi:single-stranded DNA-binding protein [Olsenella massiliensis]|uniref:single-stranded DNA-binding protein n=1 Tax=Olsenella massiliensis TaxID=1622075 RepID=UPI00071E5651|nr:single-stranded DNA-binding protein [Olsenella massiliensis]